MRLRAVFSAVLGTLAIAAPAQADTWTVTNGSSDATTPVCNTTAHTCVSLRSAIAASEATKEVADVINVPAGTITIGSDLVILSDITVNGVSARTNIIDGGMKSRALRVGTDGNAKLNHFTLRNGTGAAGGGGSTQGGGVLNMAGTVALDNVHVTSNATGAVANLAGGFLTIQHSLIDSNGGGGVVNNGGLETTPLTYVSIADSTIFNNTGAIGQPGGISNLNRGLVAVARSTIADNTGGQRATVGGIAMETAGTMQVTGSIVARNTPANCVVATRPTDGGANVEDNDTCGFNFTGTPGLDTKLSSAGGDVDVLALLSGSPAIDRLPVSTTNCPDGTLDQRGVSRPQGTACDAGAYELDQAASYTITGGPGPGATINTTSVQFDFSSTDPSATPVCQLTGPGQAGGFVACYKSNAQPYSGLANGTYAFSVRDSAFPTGPVASRTFTVAALDTTITGGPSGLTNDATPTFTFTGVNGATGFECRVDTAAFAACTPPFTTAVLASGPHTFEVRALSAAGGPDPTPTTRAFTVDAIAPNTILTPITTPTRDNTPTFSFTSSEAGGTFECRVDNAAFAACSAPFTTAALSDGSHTFDVHAIDAAGNVDASPGSQTFVVDATPPDTTITPITTTPTNDTTPTFTLTSTEPNSTFRCRVDGAAFAACTTPYTTGTLLAGNHTVQAVATDPAGNPDGSAASFAFVVDTTPPDTTITPITTTPTNDTTPTFALTSTEAGSTFRCRVDGAAFAACGTPFTTATLSEGNHTIQAVATDPAGNPDGSAASFAFVVDTTPPNTTLTPFPTPTNDTTPTFSFGSTEAGSTFQCRVDSAAFATCTTAFTTVVLTQGPHTFDVRAVDAAGNADATPGTQTFAVDTTAPVAPMITAPTEGARLATATVLLSGTAEPNARVDVREGAALRGSADVDGQGNWTASLTSVPDGPHTYSVTATDAAGNTSPAATRTVTVDAANPETTITSGPSGSTNDTTPTFTFSSDEPGTFECRLDGAAVPVCPTPFTTSALAQGAHTLEVRAIDVAGNVDATPAIRNFTVDTTPPAAPEVVSGPDGTTTDTSVEFGFAAADAVSTTCRLDGPGAVAGEFGACTSPKVFNSLAPGDYVFSVRSVDAAGNAQTTQRPFTVTVIPEATPSPSPAPTATPTPTPTPTPVGPPVANQSVDITPVSGTVLIKLPGSKVFVKLSPSLIKNGAEVDARGGVVEVTRSDGGKAKFYDGIFKLSHAGGYTILTLTEKLTGCPKAKKSAARAAAKKPKTRKLWGDGKGKFRTKGQYSAATVRGTKWLVTDTCTTTVSRVATGVVEVQDFATRKKILLKKGKSYTARPKKRG